MVHRLGRVDLRTTADTIRSPTAERYHQHLLEDAVARPRRNSYARVLHAGLTAFRDWFTGRNRNGELAEKVFVIERMCNQNCQQLAGVLSRVMHKPFDEARDQLDAEAEQVYLRMLQEHPLP